MADSVPVHEGLFTTDAEGAARLVAGKCRSCGRYQFPRAALCPYCGVHQGGGGVRAALTEGGLDRRGFRVAFWGTAWGGVAAGHKVLDALGLTGGRIVNVGAGCASGGAAVMLAAGAIRAGQYDTALVFGIE